MNDGTAKARLAEMALRAAAYMDRVPNWIGRLGAWTLVPLVLVIFYDVIARRYLRHLDFVIENDLQQFMNSPKLQDSEWHFSAVLFFVGLGYALRHNVHIRLDLLRQRLTAEQRVWIEFTGTLLLFIPFLCLLFGFSWPFVYEAWVTGEQSAATTGLSNRWAIKAFLIVGFGAALLAGIALLLRTAIWLFGPSELRRQALDASFTGNDNEACDPASDVQEI